MTKKLSFILPVYNVEAYLDECVQSILPQLTSECEMILVDDGSADASGIICDRYADDPRVRVIHQQNGGHSAARNNGLDAAEGAYVAFVDSDDYLAKDCVAGILNYIRQGGCDVCFMQACKFFPDGEIRDLGDDIRREYIFQKSKEDVMQYLSTRPKYPGSACTKIFRREFLERNGLRFPMDLLHGEDLTLCMQALMKAETFDALDIPYYFYRQNRPGSVTTRIGKRSFFDLAEFVKKHARKDVCDVAARCAMSFVAYEYSILLWQYAMLPSECRTEALSFLKKYRFVLKYGANRKLRVIRVMTAVLGLRTVSRLLAIYMRHRNG